MGHVKDGGYDNNRLETGLNYLDKTSISYASIMGIQEDLNLKGDDYEWLASMFYFGYLGWEYPTNRLLQRFPIGKYSAACIIAWGTVLACFAAVTNFGGAVVIRFMLGVTEAAVTPGFALSKPIKHASWKEMV